MLRITGELADLAERSGRDAESGPDQRPPGPAPDRAAGPADGSAGRSTSWPPRSNAAGRVVAADPPTAAPGRHPTRPPGWSACTTRDARPIAKGRINRPVEFGYKAQVVDNEDGIVVDYTVEEGNPADAPQLAPAIERITHRVGQATASGDRRPRLRRGPQSRPSYATSA